MPGSAVSVAIVGATGAVGRALVQAIEESDLDIGELRLFASERSAGSEIDFRGELARVGPLRDGAFRDLDLAFFSATAEVARAWAGRAWAAGCPVIDLSPAFRADADVPLVVAELNPGDVGGFRARGLVATPGPGAVQLALVLSPIHAAVGVERAVVTTCEAVSGAGQPAVDELESEMRAMLAFQEPPPPTVLPHRIAFNLIPQVGSMGEDGVSDEERAIVAETRRLLGADPPRIAALALRVPVFYGHAQAVNIRTSRPLSAADARALLARAPGVKVVDAPAQGVYPMPMLAVNDDAVLVGRVRDDATQERGLDLFLTADNVRKGGASNAFAVARLLLERRRAQR